MSDKQVKPRNRTNYDKSRGVEDFCWTMNDILALRGYKPKSKKRR